MDARVKQGSHRDDVGRVLGADCCAGTDGSRGKGWALGHKVLRNPWRRTGS